MSGLQRSLPSTHSTRHSVSCIASLNCTHTPGRPACVVLCSCSSICWLYTAVLSCWSGISCVSDSQKAGLDTIMILCLSYLVRAPATLNHKAAIVLCMILLIAHARDLPVFLSRHADQIIMAEQTDCLPKPLRLEAKQEPKAHDGQNATQEQNFIGPLHPVIQFIGYARS